ncbi:MAG TPA: hypothetical protein VFF11_03760, partial [Candidatus Binatia bacterium]|nr:hypothetical protein [Candidatus Binatia bacterium]
MSLPGQCVKLGAVTEGFHDIAGAMVGVCSPIFHPRDIANECNIMNMEYRKTLPQIPPKKILRHIRKADFDLRMPTISNTYSTR